MYVHITYLYIDAPNVYLICLVYTFVILYYYRALDNLHCATGFCTGMTRKKLISEEGLLQSSKGPTEPKNWRANYYFFMDNI